MFTVSDSLTVVVRLVGPSGLAVAAISRINIQHGLVASADVRLGSVEPRYLAHEIEHVLEQLDGVDLRSAVTRGVRGVATVRPELFETARAIASERRSHTSSTCGRSQGHRQRKSTTHRGG
jgi:hypothetical protein